MDLRGPELIAQALLYAPGKIRTCGLRIRSDSKGIPNSFPISTFCLLITRFAGYFMGRVFPILRDRILLATIQKLYSRKQRPLCSHGGLPLISYHYQR